jgi:hypothetical protein
MIKMIVFGPMGEQLAAELELMREKEFLMEAFR